MTCTDCRWATNSISAAFYQRDLAENKTDFVDMHYQPIAIPAEVVAHPSCGFPLRLGSSI